MKAIEAVKQIPSGNCYTYDENGNQIGTIRVGSDYTLTGHTSDTVFVKSTSGTIYLYDAWGNLKDSLPCDMNYVNPFGWGHNEQRKNYYGTVEIHLPEFEFKGSVENAGHDKYLHIEAGDHVEYKGDIKMIGEYKGHKIDIRSIPDPEAFSMCAHVVNLDFEGNGAVRAYKSYCAENNIEYEFNCSKILEFFDKCFKDGVIVKPQILYGEDSKFDGFLLDMVEDYFEEADEFELLFEFEYKNGKLYMVNKKGDTQNAYFITSNKFDENNLTQKIYNVVKEIEAEEIRKKKDLILFSKDSRILSFAVFAPENAEEKTEWRVEDKFQKAVERCGFPFRVMKYDALKERGDRYLVLNLNIDDAVWLADQLSSSFLFGSRWEFQNEFDLEYYEKDSAGTYYKVDPSGTVFDEFFKNPDIVHKNLERFEQHFALVLAEKDEHYNGELWMHVFEQNKYSERSRFEARAYLYKWKDFKEKI